MERLTIGQLAKQAGVGVETIRFYERQGLLPEPARTASGYRLYPADVVERLRFVRQAKELGFTLKEIRELLELRLDPSTTCADVKSRATAKVADIEDKIRSLQKMKQALLQLNASCDGRGPVADCPILDSMREGTAKAGKC